MIRRHRLFLPQRIYFFVLLQPVLNEVAFGTFATSHLDQGRFVSLQCGFVLSCSVVYCECWFALVILSWQEPEGILGPIVHASFVLFKLKNNCLNVRCALLWEMVILCFTFQEWLPEVYGSILCSLGFLIKFARFWNWKLLSRNCLLYCLKNGTTNS